jgi:hypothetical protein
MVAKVTTPKGINRVLNYNEQKIKTGKAECILCASVHKKRRAFTLSREEKQVRKFDDA